MPWADRSDEVWEGVYVVNPLPLLGHQRTVVAFGEAVRSRASARGLVVVPGVNVGHQYDYRGPDVALVPADADPRTLYFDTVPVVVEVRSPHEDPEPKLPFYLARGVREVVLPDGNVRSVRWLAARHGAWVDVDRSDVLDVEVTEISGDVSWP